jgi:potassium efflux system protein
MAPQGEALDLAGLDARRAQVETDPALGEDIRKPALDVLDEARTQLVAEAKWQETRAKLRASLEGARGELERIAALLAAPKAEPRLTVDYSSSLTDLDSELAARLQEQSDLAKALQDQEAELRRLEGRRQELPKQLAELRAERLEAQPRAEPGTETEPPSLALARRLRKQARLQRIDAALAAVEFEQSSFETQLQLAQARRDELRHRAATTDAVVQRLQQIASDARRAEIDRMERRARSQQRGLAAAIQDAAERNLALIRAQREVADEREAMTRLRAEIDRQRGLLDQEFGAAEQRIRLVGLTETIGLELRQLRNSRLGDIEALRRRHRELGRRQIAAYEARFGYEDELGELGDLDAAVPAELERLAVPDGQRAGLAEPTRRVLETRREIVGALTDAFYRLTTEYSAAETALLQLLERAETVGDFIGERVLWIPSTQPIWSARLRDLLVAAGGLATACSAGAAAIRAGIAEHPIGAATALLAVLGLLLARPFLLRRLAVHATAARHRTTVSIAPTTKALADTVLLALPLPALLLAAFLMAGPESGVAAFRAGLLDAAVTLFALATVRELGRADGLGEAHFDWSPALLRDLRRSLRWLAPLLVAFAFATAVLVAQGAEEGQGELARVLALPPICGLAVVLARLLHPTRGSLRPSTGALGTAHRARIGLFVLGLGLPIALAGLALLGYAFTTIELYTRLLRTLVLALTVLLATSLVYRWLLLSRRSLAIQQARERRRLLKEQGGESPTELEQQAVDLAAVDQQTRSLVRAASVFVLALGAWAIWIDVLPALGMLHQVEFWDETVQTTVVEKAADGSELLRTVDTLRPITLASVLLALIILFGTGVLSRNLGGLLEIVLLRHLHVQAGERYAITTITRYVIVAVGVLAAFGTVGLGWSKVQWLVAAVSVGLGFGLQEIFANFVSGLILLFERPMRVGDLVTVGEVDGRVARIQMRATTIVDFDRKELIVPNRDFISSRFVNWSLTSPITRLVVKVGVAYGTDTARAQQLLLDCAQRCRTVLRDPPPNTVFHGFGASSLDLELRVFIASMDDWVDAMNEVHRAVDEAFRAAGIEIAFPQRDLHIRSAPGLAGVFASVEPAPPPPAPDPTDPQRPDR